MNGWKTDLLSLQKEGPMEAPTLERRAGRTGQGGGCPVLLTDGGLWPGSTAQAAQISAAVREVASASGAKMWLAVGPS